MAVYFISQGVKKPRLFASFPIVLAAKIQNFVLEGFVTVPAVGREDAAITKGLRALIDPNDGHVVWTIAKLSCTVHGAHRDP
jgi:hypothetical protein